MESFDENCIDWCPFFVKAITDYNGFCHSLCECNSLAKVSHLLAVRKSFLAHQQMIVGKKLKWRTKWHLQKKCQKKPFLHKEDYFRIYNLHDSWTCSRCFKKDTCKVWTTNSMLRKWKRPFCTCSVFVLCPLAH